MRTILPWVLTAAVAVMAVAAVARADRPVPATGPSRESAPLRADLHADRTTIQAGQPVWVTCTLTNLTAQPVTLKVPEIPVAESTAAEVGLPVSHVFSGPRYGAMSIKDGHGEEFDTQVASRSRGPAPAIRLAPYGSVGLRLDLVPHYPSMKRPGKYTLIWRPYFAAIESAPLTLTILAERQAVVLTEFGAMTIRFYYDEAPETVQNFLELTERHFYDRLTFHKIVPNALVQGGDPRGDGKGGRPDGKRVKAEFSNIPFVAGTVGMARMPSDPDSASSQFFITVSRQAGLDGNQTAFGYLVGAESFQTLEKLAAVPTDDRGRPRPPVAIRAITLDNVPMNREPETAGLDPRNRPAATQPAIIVGASGGAITVDGPTPASHPAP